MNNIYAFKSQYKDKFYINLPDDHCCEYANMCVDRYRQYMKDNYNGQIESVENRYDYKKYIRLFFNTMEDCENAVDYINSCMVMKKLKEGK